MNREDIPISRRGGLDGQTKHGFFRVTLEQKKIIKQHEINKNKLYKIEISIVYQKKKKKIFYFFTKKNN